MCYSAVVEASKKTGKERSLRHQSPGGENIPEFLKYLDVIPINSFRYVLQMAWPLQFVTV